MRYMNCMASKIGNYQSVIYNYKKMEKIKIELLEGGIRPNKEFNESAGYDLYIPKRTFVPAGRSIIPLGFKIALPRGKKAFIFSRSGIAAKGVPGWLSESQGKLCNCEVKQGILDEEKYYDMAKDEDVYIEHSRKINLPDGSTAYDAVFRVKVFDSVRIPQCDIELGMLDCGYRGEVGLIINNRDVGFYLEREQSIAQMVISDVPDTELLPVDKLDGGEGERGEQGFNS